MGSFLRFNQIWTHSNRIENFIQFHILVKMCVENDSRFSCGMAMLFMCVKGFLLDERKLSMLPVLMKFTLTNTFEFDMRQWINYHHHTFHNIYIYCKGKMTFHWVDGLLIFLSKSTISYIVWAPNNQVSFKSI